MLYTMWTWAFGCLVIAVAVAALVLIPVGALVFLLTDTDGGA